MQNQFESRFNADLTEDSGKIVGYAALFNSDSHDLGGFIERIAPGAFDRTLKENPDVLALFEHDMTKVLGRTANGSLLIYPDERGLRIELTPSDTSWSRDLLALVRRGDVTGASFRFKPYPGGATMDLSKTPAIRTLRSVQLKEVSIVVDPAFPETSVSVRALDEARHEQARHALQRMRLRLAQHNYEQR